MDQKAEFINFARCEGANFRQLCRRFGISPTTGYMLLRRYEKEGDAGLLCRSRRPHLSPGRTAEQVEQWILGARARHPAWGARKLKRWLEDQGRARLPAASTVHAILQRHHCIGEAQAAQQRAYVRFEQAQPNDLWQMDFKGHFQLRGERCHPLTVLDDHSRYGLCLAACADERHETVQHHLIRTFRRYGLPRRITMDNGSPWGDRPGSYTQEEVWLMRLGIKPSHSRPYHPQTQGKDERFHRTLKVELLQGRHFIDLEEVQSAFNSWLAEYNMERPHGALAMATPSTRYQPSPREYPEQLPTWEYDVRDQVRKVQGNGEVHFLGRIWKLGKAFIGERVAFRAAADDGQYGVFLGTHRIAHLDLKIGCLTSARSRG